MTDSSPKVHLTVACVCEKNNRFLMVEEYQNNERVINQPAGHVEPGESLTSAAVRETFEETGYQVELSHLLGLSILRVSPGKTYYRVSFIARCLDLLPDSEIDQDILAVRWMSAEEIFNCDKIRNPLVHNDLDRFIRGDRYPLHMLAEDFIYPMQVHTDD